MEISIADVNDEAPVFKPGQETIEVTEDTAPGTVVHTLVANDKDHGDNGTVTYALKSGGGGHFRVEPDTGNILVQSGLDREQQAKHRLRILATDNGSPMAMSSTLTIAVNVKDVNDNSPMFYPSKVIVSLRNVERGFVTQVKATDQDEGTFAQVAYGWADPARVPRFLSLNETTGKVTLNRNMRTYGAEVKILAVDGGGRKSPQPLSLTIIKKDLVLSEEEFQFQIHEDRAANLEQGRTVGQIQSAGGEGTYQIVDGDSEGVFSINECGNASRFLSFRNGMEC